MLTSLLFKSPLADTATMAELLFSREYIWVSFDGDEFLENGWDRVR